MLRCWPLDQGLPVSSLRSPSDFKGGRSLESALRSFSDATLLAELAQLEASIAPLITVLGCEAVVQGINPYGVRKKLEEEFLNRLRIGELLATGAFEPKPFLPSYWPIGRKIIAPSQWFALEPEFNNSTATLNKEVKLYDILVFDRIKLLGALEPQAKPQSPPALALKTRTAVASGDFSKVVIDGKALSFGPKQAKALRELYDASAAGQPWLGKNDLLQRAGSQLFSIKEAFRDKDWQLVIEEGRLEDGHSDQVRLCPDLSISVPDLPAD